MVTVLQVHVYTFLYTESKGSLKEMSGMANHL